MPDIQGLLSSLRREYLAVLQERGPDQILDPYMLDAIDRAAGGPGEGRGYYVVRGSLNPQERRRYYLRDDVVAAIFAPSTLEDAAGADASPPGRRRGLEAKLTTTPQRLHAAPELLSVRVERDPEPVSDGLEAAPSGDGSTTLAGGGRLIIQPVRKLA